jgi:hypothetical protein
MRWEMAVIVAFASTLSACSSTLSQFDPAVAAQHNYDIALADYQNCYAAKRSVDACEQESQMLNASTKVLASFIASGH